MTAVKCS